ncbi:hypothetical protein VNO77_04712 [Canavalia gladiata]|uniref:Uncharacterized protein n=1 Tax=Canavalia gladiata TaxID=3824 RepID=A0AAN9MX09_CANGL
MILRSGSVPDLLALWANVSLYLLNGTSTCCHPFLFTDQIEWWLKVKLNVISDSNRCSLGCAIGLFLLMEFIDRVQTNPLLRTVFTSLRQGLRLFYSNSHVSSVIRFPQPTLILLRLGAVYIPRPVRNIESTADVATSTGFWDLRISLFAVKALNIATTSMAATWFKTKGTESYPLILANRP